VTSLSGTGRLADDLYLLSHHEITGKPHLQPRALGLGLAGGLLAELLLSGSINLWRGTIVTADGVPPRDDIARSVLNRVHSERQQLVARDWLLFLGHTAVRDVARRLEQAGYLTRIATRRFSRTERWVPADPDCAFAPMVRVKSVMESFQPVSAQNATLAGLATACGLGSRLALYLPADAPRRLEEALTKLAPDLFELIIQTRAAVDSAVLTHRV
jgi:hypothetical protein